MHMKTRVFINAGSTISHQPTFGENGFSAFLKPLADGHELIQPAYKEYIDPLLLRRMSRMLRTGVACSVRSLQTGELSVPAGIIVGTGLGCLQDTEKFLNNFLTLSGLLPPTSFILSTHNTVAGQISLSLGCHGYNITHTQNTVSFEVALLDAVLKLEEGEGDLLVGAADEYIPFLDKVAEAWGYDELPLTSGTSFFVVSSEPSAGNLAEVIDLKIEVGGEKTTKEMVVSFLDECGLGIKDMDLLLGTGAAGAARIGFEGSYVDYLSLTGLYPTASAFGFHYGIDCLQTFPGKRYVLIVNELSSDRLGLILLKAVEA